MINNVLAFGLFNYGPESPPPISLNNVYNNITSSDNIWTGDNIFSNITIVNYTYLNVTGNITADEYCFNNGSCIDKDAEYKATWGNITGQLSSQTDLWTVLEEINQTDNTKYEYIQNYTINICPVGKYAYGRYQNGTWICRTENSDIQNLQSVTDIGSSTTNNITVENGVITNKIVDVENKEKGIYFENGVIVVQG